MNPVVVDQDDFVFDNKNITSYSTFARWSGVENKVDHGSRKWYKKPISSYGLCQQFGWATMMLSLFDVFVNVFVFMQMETFS